MYIFIIQLIIQIISIVVLFYRIFISNSSSPMFILLVLIILLVLTKNINRPAPIRTRKRNEAMSIIAMTTFVFMSFLYALGLKTGFNQNYTFMFKSYINNNVWILAFIIVYLTEFVRYLICCLDYKKKKQKVIITITATIIFILVDIVISTRTYSFSNFKQTYTFISLILLPSITKNLLLNYITKRFEYYPSLIYRVIMDLYIYYLPVTPKVNDFIAACLYLVFPYIVYIFLIKLAEEKEPISPRDVKHKHNIFGDLIYYGIVIVFVMLISREFTYSIIAIGSNSMKGCFSKGDAVIYKRYENDDLEKGNIILFNKEGRVIVHRINKKIKKYGGYKYITKGDANMSIDNWTVSEDEIVGIVKCKVKYIGWPTVLISENYK